MAKETLKQSSVEVNDNQASDIKNKLKEFLDTHNVIEATKNELKPLFTDVVDLSIADKIETTVNKEHIKNLLITMKDEFKEDNSNYKDAYAKRGKAMIFGLQSALSIMGYNIGTDLVDGRIGGATRKAIMQFQQLNNLSSVDGAAGYETFTALANANLDVKITDADKNIVPVKKRSENTQTSSSTKVDVYAAIQPIEYDLNGTMQKKYVVEKIGDIPATILKDTVIQYKDFYFYANGRVFEYGADGKAIRKGQRDEIGDDGNWKELPIAGETIPSKPVDTKVEIKDQTATFEQLQNNLSKVRDKCIVGFTQKWQKDRLKKTFNKGIELSYYTNGIGILNNKSSVHTIDYSKLGGNKESISTKKFINNLKEYLTTTMDKEHDNTLIATHLEGKSFMWSDIFTDADNKDPVMKSKIDKLKGLFKKSNNGKGDGMDISDVSVKIKDGKKTIKFDYDNDGLDTKWTTNWTKNYNEVFDENGSFDKKAFSTKLRNSIVSGLFNSPKHTKDFTNLNPLDLG